MSNEGVGWVGGVCWKTNPPCQEVVKISTADACALKQVGRMEKLRQTGAHLHLLNSPPVHSEQRLLIAGTKEAVFAAKEALGVMLSKDLGTTLAVHPHDPLIISRTVRGDGVKAIENASGCRVVVDRKNAASNILGHKHHHVHLLGDDNAQEQAQKLLEQGGYIEKLTLPPDGAAYNKGFSQNAKGSRIEVSKDGTRAKRINGDGKTKCQCVVGGDGQVQQYAQGSFWCFAVRALDNSPHLHGSFRFGMAEQPLESPPPESLLTKPAKSWVVGGGRVRSPGVVGPVVGVLAGTNFDALEMNDEVGVLATQSGALAVFMRKGSTEPGVTNEWTCTAHWNAGVTNPLECYLMLELAGRVREVELLRDGPPFDIMCDVDEAKPVPKLWP
jgi:hypothetical protein